VTLSEILSFSGECLEFLSIAKGSAGHQESRLGRNEEEHVLVSSHDLLDGGPARQRLATRGVALKADPGELKPLRNKQALSLR
jgi:hypothetical protein